jgi:hypothetical protein
LSAVLLTHYCQGDKIEKNEMVGACSAYGVGERRVRPRHRWRIILRWIFRKWDVGVLTGLSWLRIETGGGHL